MTPSLHHLNKVCAEFCGVEVYEDELRTAEGRSHVGWVIADGYAESGQEWNPCQDHNQGAEVKAKLREKGRDYHESWNSNDRVHYFEIGKEDESGWILTKHESELIALLLAVEALGKP